MGVRYSREGGRKGVVLNLPNLITIGAVDQCVEMADARLQAKRDFDEFAKAQRKRRQKLIRRDRVLPR